MIVYKKINKKDRIIRYILYILYKIEKLIYIYRVMRLNKKVFFSFYYIQILHIILYSEVKVK
jgi:hypothetical protein